MRHHRIDQFHVAVHCHGSTAVVEAAGEIDLATVDPFREAVDAAVDLHVPIEIDLRNTTFMGSTGLAVLARAHRRCDPRFHPISLIGPRPTIRKALEVTGLEPMFEIRVDATSDGVPQGDSSWDLHDTAGTTGTARDFEASR
jgi:anti-anti-sigma factor